MRAEEISADVCRSSARLGRQMEFALAEAGITLSQYRLLALMSEGSAAGAVLADKLSVSRPTVSGVIDGLVARGLVMREDDPSDRRRILAGLTPRGKSILKAADDAVAGRLIELLSCVTAEEAAIAIQGLQIFHDALDIRREAKLQGE